MSHVQRVTLPFTPRAWQMPLINDPAKRIVAVVHRRAGKSTALMWRSIKRALTTPRANPPPRIIHTLPVQVQWARTGMWDVLARVGSLIPDTRVFKSELRLVLPNGAIYQAGGMDKPDSWRGGYADEVILDEYDDTHAEGQATAIEPMLSDFNGVLVRSGTPKGYERLKGAYERAGGMADRSRYLLRYQDTGAMSEQAIADLRAEMTPEEFAQEMECFPPGSMVATADDVRPIETLRAGDLVWTHAGRLRPVKQAMQRHQTGELVVIEAYGSRALRLTPEHPVRVYRPGDQDYHWIKATDIARGDWLVTPKKHIGTPVVAAPLAELIAWFVAEGSVSQNAVSFSLGEHETSPSYSAHGRDSLADVA